MNLEYLIESQIALKKNKETNVKVLPVPKLGQCEHQNK